MDFDEDPNYLDLDDILAHTQQVDCKFLLNIPGLRFLWPHGLEDDTQDKSVTLPFWMAKTLYTYSMIDIEWPKSYQFRFREVIEGGPDVVDLHRAGPNFYTFGKLLLNLRREKGNNLAAYSAEGQRNKFKREEGETLGEASVITDCLMKTFHIRRHKIMSHSTSESAARGETTKLEVDRLDNLEKRLLRVGEDQREQMTKWKTRRIELIGNNPIAIRLSKKRKMIEKQ